MGRGVSDYLSAPTAAAAGGTGVCVKIFMMLRPHRRRKGDGEREKHARDHRQRELSPEAAPPEAPRRIRRGQQVTHRRLPCIAAV